MKIVLLLTFMLTLGLTAAAQSIAEPLAEGNIPASIADPGYGEHPRFLADVNGDGVKDFCRVVGDKPGVFLSCALGQRGGFGENQYAFNSEKGTDLGFAGTAWMQDVNGDGRMDFCRKVGSGANTFFAAMLAGTTGFSRDAHTRIAQTSNGRWAVAGGAQNYSLNATGANSRGNVPPVNAAASTGTFKEIWVEHNKVQNGRKGMLVHSWFSVQNALGKPSRLVAEFQWQDGAKLAASEAAYASAQGNVMATQNFTPGFAQAVYSDLKLFLPYAALNMEPGKSGLRVRLTLYDVTTKRHFAYSDYTNFTFTQN